MQQEHTALRIQNVTIETVQAHCYTLVAPTIGPGLIPTATG